MDTSLFMGKWRFLFHLFELLQQIVKWCDSFRIHPHVVV